MPATFRSSLRPFTTRRSGKGIEMPKFNDLRLSEFPHGGGVGPTKYAWRAEEFRDCNCPDCEAEGHWFGSSSISAYGAYGVTLWPTFDEMEREVKKNHAFYYRPEYNQPIPPRHTVIRPVFDPIEPLTEQPGS